MTGEGPTPPASAPPDALLVAAARGLRGAPPGQARVMAAGAQVPLPFPLDLPPGPGATPLAATVAEGAPRWLPRPAAVPPRRRPRGARPPDARPP